MMGQWKSCMYCQGLVYSRVMIAPQTFILLNKPEVLIETRIFEHVDTPLKLHGNMIYEPDPKPFALL